MMVSAYFGIPKCFREMQSCNLENSKYHIRTAMGDSQASYTHSPETPIHGTGQGSCSSPAIWLMISSFIMDILQMHANGMTMVDITNNNKTIQWIEGFVDDTSLFSNTNFKNNNIEELKEKLRHDSNYWAGVLSATGGKLELTKCFYYLLTWKWDKQGNPLPQSMQEQELRSNTIGITNMEGETALIQQRDINTSHKTLGAYKSIIGDQKDHYKYLLDKSNKYGSKVCTSQFN
jgi:hypothetical protein